MRHLAVIIVSCFALGGAYFAFSHFHEKDNRDASPEVARWRERIARIGDSGAYGEFRAEAAGLPFMQQHVLAHAFGSAIYDAKGLDGFATCGDEFGYGCLHAILTRALADQGPSAFDSLNEKCLERHDDPSPISCVHGMGHALVAEAGYDLRGLIKALDNCDKLSHDPLHGCYSGAFMEFGQHIMLNLHEGTAGLREIPDNDPSDPCDSLEGQRRAICTYWQPHWWSSLADEKGQTIADRMKEEGAWCRELDALVSDEKGKHCFEGLGTTLVQAPENRLDPEIIVPNCTRAAGSSSSTEALKCIFAGARMYHERGIFGARDSICASVGAAEKSHCEDYAQDKTTYYGDPTVRILPLSSDDSS